MRKSMALVIAISILGASPSLNEPARADLVEYSLLLQAVAWASSMINVVENSDLPPAQKERLIL